jgi:uncharacterized protein (DUF1499 family)
MKTVVLIIIFLLLAGSAGFFFLAQRSKTGTAPGIVNGRLAPCPTSPNCVSSEKGAPKDKSIAPFPLLSWADLPDIVQANGGRVVNSRPDYLAAEFSTPLMGFVDDVEFRKGETEVHVRSASRVGHSDMGANRKRVEKLRADLKE